MLSCEGYKMFKGTMLVDYKNGMKPFPVTGTWLFKPDNGYWYVTPTKDFPWGTSFKEKMVTVLEEIA